MTVVENRIGIAIGPQTWFGDRFLKNVSRGGIVRNNLLSGAFSYGIAITSAVNFTVQENSFFGNSSFIGARGVNCSATDIVPTPQAFIIQANTTSAMSISSDFVNIEDGDSLTCVLPPNGGDFWPLGLNPSNTTSTENPTNPTTTPGSSSGSPSNNNGARTGAIVGGVICALLVCGVAAWLVRRYILRKKMAPEPFNKISN